MDLKIEGVRSELKEDISNLRNELKEDIHKLDLKIEGVRSELKEDINKLDLKIEGVRSELKEDIHKLDLKIDGVRSELKGDIKNFAKILGKSWEAKKRVSSSISNSEIDRVYNLAMENGAYSGKVSGAGGGGFMFFMVNPTKKLQLIQILNKQQGKVINFKFTKEGTKGWKIQ